ncbi:Caprin-2 [Bulinus truncatus]|nr:Caprin-2 [Bulinus truncatus]
MTSSKRAPRRNRNRAQMRDSEVDDEAQDDDVCELEVTCRSGKSLPVALPINGPRGPSGKPGSPGLPGKPGPAGAPGDTGRDIDDVARVAFFAGLTKNIGPFSRNTDLILDRVVTNVGEGFNVQTGRFTAPLNGTYAFAVTIAAQGRQKAAVELVLNGKMVTTIWAESFPSWASASNNVILNMEAGDQVWLVLLTRASHVHGYMYTTFSGHCLYRGL